MDFGLKDQGQGQGLTSLLLRGGEEKGREGEEGVREGVENGKGGESVPLALILQFDNCYERRVKCSEKQRWFCVRALDYFYPENLGSNPAVTLMEPV